MFAWPPDHEQAILESLCYAGRKYCEAERFMIEPSEKEFKYVLDAAEELYSVARPLNKFRFPSYGEFEALIREEIEWTSTPGIPYNRIASNNEGLFGWNGVTVDKTKTRYIYTCVQERWKELLSGPAMDPINFFIKAEPHKAKKVTDRAWRIIHGVSIVDNLISRILLGTFVNNMLNKYNVLPNKAGWVTVGGGYKWLLNRLPKMKLMADKSAWDFTLQRWVVEGFVGLLDRLYQFTATEEWRLVTANHFASLFHGCIYSTGRWKIRQTCFGVMKTGSYLTISFNSIAQVFLHVLASIRSQTDWRATVPFCLGDDTIQTAAVSSCYVAELGRTGCIVKEHDVSELASFGGHVFTMRGCVPSYTAKHCWLILHSSPDTIGEMLESYQYLYTHDKRLLELVQELLLRYNPVALRSVQYLLAWYEGDEGRVFGNCAFDSGRGTGFGPVGWFDRRPAGILMS